MPVVNGDDKLLGIVSEGDLMRRPENNAKRRPSWWLAMLRQQDDLAGAYVKSHGQHARDVMTDKVATADEDTPVGEIAQLLERNRIQRVPITSEGRVVGIVSRANQFQGLVAAKDTELASPSADDRTIRKNLLRTLEREFGVTAHQVDIVVADGTAHLWGTFDSPQVRDAVRVAAEASPGIAVVENNINLMPKKVRAWMTSL